MESLSVVTHGKNGPDKEFSALSACAEGTYYQRQRYHEEITMKRIIKVVSVVALVTALSGCLFPTPGGGGGGGGPRGGFSHGPGF
ncbi:hypothetical protein ACFFJN_08715 [Erwinia mallotivora]|uniref:hypothetical protein n=1 Tax=Erwinia mallotivora TaxID=69222 RepID=UPI0035EE51AA